MCVYVHLCRHANGAESWLVHKAEDGSILIYIYIQYIYIYEGLEARPAGAAVGSAVSRYANGAEA